MNELQKCEFEILKEVNKVCEQLNITFFMVCGSALGAVKYNGFIPWDDDIDIGMFREEYTRFVKEAPEYLPKSLFLQNYSTDSGFAHIYSKIRNNNTTYIEKSSAHLNINHGVYIDIFPLDGYPTDEKEQEKVEKKKRAYKLFTESSFNFERSYKVEILTKSIRIISTKDRIKRALRKYEEMISSYSIQNSKVICNHGNWQGKLEYAEKEQYGEGIWAEFEGLKVRIPEKYDEYLTQKYGDWRAELPKEKQIGHHYYTVCDLNKSYIEYKK